MKLLVTPVVAPRVLVLATQDVAFVTQSAMTLETVVMMSHWIAIQQVSCFPIFICIISYCNSSSVVFCSDG